MVRRAEVDGRVFIVGRDDCLVDMAQSGNKTIRKPRPPESRGPDLSERDTSR